MCLNCSRSAKLGHFGDLTKREHQCHRRHKYTLIWRTASPEDVWALFRKTERELDSRDKDVVHIESCIPLGDPENNPPCYSKFKHPTYGNKDEWTTQFAPGGKQLEWEKPDGAEMCRTVPGQPWTSLEGRRHRGNKTDNEGAPDTPARPVDETEKSGKRTDLRSNSADQAESKTKDPKAYPTKERPSSDTEASEGRKKGKRHQSAKKHEEGRPSKKMKATCTVTSSTVYVLDEDDEEMETSPLLGTCPTESPIPKTNKGSGTWESTLIDKPRTSSAASSRPEEHNLSASQMPTPQGGGSGLDTTRSTMDTPEMETTVPGSAGSRPPTRLDCYTSSESSQDSDGDSSPVSTDEEETPGDSAKPPPSKPQTQPTEVSKPPTELPQPPRHDQAEPSVPLPKGDATPLRDENTSTGAGTSGANNNNSDSGRVPWPRLTEQGTVNLIDNSRPYWCEYTTQGEVTAFYIVDQQTGLVGIARLPSGQVCHTNLEVHLDPAGRFQLLKLQPGDDPTDQHGSAGQRTGVLTTTLKF